ncbi:hypothetical protein GCM10007857_38430 [Bradyrhizobium iriomotense]|uniref:Uncharacterized protein n=1 Tax=Bradyrhizobium iriomotense TaxID=441950 RepID=A0ABQ6AY88_9BRAD|nr:hypothetical protein GCM10007857_38430 [Bradyrhizobium iriomotense]
MLNWWIGSIFIGAASLGLPGEPAGLCMPAGPARPGEAGAKIPLGSGYEPPRLLEPAPADLTTFTTPATKPSSVNTINPKGDVDSKRSKPQPIPAPTMTPAINSEDSRKPSAIAEALAAPSPPSPAGCSVLILRSRNSDNR